MAEIPRSLVMTITPFDAQGRIDEAEFRRHLRRFVEAGIGVYLGSPGYGEIESMTSDELVTLYSIGVDELSGKAPVWACCVEPRSSGELVRTARLAVAARVEGLLVYPLDRGHSIAPTPTELERYYREILDELDVPIVISTLSRGYRLSLGLLEKLASSYEQVRAVNVHDGDFLVDVHRELGERLRIYAGGANVASNLALGGHGFSSSEANLAPFLARSVVELWKQGSFLEAFAQFRRMRELTRLLSRMPLGPSRIKPALSLLGLPGGLARSPFLPPAANVLEDLQSALDAYDVLGTEAHSRLLV